MEENMSKSKNVKEDVVREPITEETKVEPETVVREPVKVETKIEAPKPAAKMTGGPCI